MLRDGSRSLNSASAVWQTSHTKRPFFCAENGEHKLASSPAAGGMSPLKIYGPCWVRRGMANIYGTEEGTAKVGSAQSAKWLVGGTVAMVASKNHGEFHFIIFHPNWRLRHVFRNHQMDISMGKSSNSEFSSYVWPEANDGEFKKINGSVSGSDPTWLWLASQNKLDQGDGPVLWVDQPTTLL